MTTLILQQVPITVLQLLLSVGLSAVGLSKNQRDKNY